MYRRDVTAQALTLIAPETSLLGSLGRETNRLATNGCRYRQSEEFVDAIRFVLVCAGQLKPLFSALLVLLIFWV